jgi:hypothetical protein
MSQRKSWSGCRRWIFALGVAAIVLLLGLVALRLITGHGLGIWTFVSSTVRSILDHDVVINGSQGEFTNVIFLHLSTGRNLIDEGVVRERFSAAGYQFWDHDYNWIGLRDPAGEYTGYGYNVPDSNTNPDGLARLFAQRVYDLPLNAFSRLLQHEVIAFKSCFPASQITSDEQLAQYKAWYLAMRDVMDAQPERVFVVMSPPPLNPAATDAKAAARARAFAEWLGSDEYLAGHPNVFMFDFFGHLAEDDPGSPEYNMLRAAYRRDGEDSHPNELANQTVGPLFAGFVMEAAEAYRATYAGDSGSQ